jgi:hypothetical protein
MREITAAALLFTVSLCGSPGTAESQAAPSKAQVCPSTADEPTVSPAEEERAEWSGSGDGVSYGYPSTDIIPFRAICTPDKLANIFVEVRPKAKGGQKTRLSFRHGRTQISYLAALTVDDGYANDVELTVPTSATLFKLLQRGGEVIVEVPGDRTRLPPEGRAAAVAAFLKDCR